jgi:hypothetical protein
MINVNNIGRLSWVNKFGSFGYEAGKCGAWIGAFFIIQSSLDVQLLGSGKLIIGSVQPKRHLSRLRRFIIESIFNHLPF